MKSAPPRPSRAVAAALAAAVLGGTLAVASPASAAFHPPRDFNRATVAVRANAWVGYRVPYSQTSWLNGYRQDCSGYVSMAWGLRKSYVTWTLPEVAWPIHKSDLAMGDIMLDKTGASQHVVIFDKWANAAHTAYWEWELAGSTGRPVHRVVKYPFWTSDADDYEPYRFAVAPYYIGKQPPKPAVRAKASAPRPSKAATATHPAARPAPKASPKPAPPHAAGPDTKRASVAGKSPADPGARPSTPETPKRPAPRVRDRAEPRAQREHIVVTLLRSLIAWLAD